MEHAVHLVVLLSALFCPSSCIPHHRYKLFNIPKTWTEAQSFCRENCLDLATVEDMEEMKLLRSSIKADTVAWIGLRNGADLVWKWSLVERGGETGMHGWHYPVGLSSCVYYKDGTLTADGCARKHQFVCIDGNKSGHERYVVVNEIQKWLTAQNYCRTYHTDLASLRNEEENQTLLAVTHGMDVWIGLFKDPWWWSDSSSSSFRYWVLGSPVVLMDPGYCTIVVKAKGAKWERRPCGTTNAFVCSCPEHQILQVKMSSALDPNDPAVLDGIISEWQQRLGENGLTNQVRLKWRERTDGKTFTKSSEGEHNNNEAPTFS